MDITKPKAFLIQISLYLKNNDAESAYSMSKDFVAKFPSEMAAHYLLAFSALGSKRYEEAKMEGRKAFNMASSDEDMLTCALLASMAYYELKDYAKGYELLLAVEKRAKTAELEKLMVLFSLAANSPEEAFRHEEELFRLNSKAAIELLAKITSGLA
jgi:tetratricopeptide (TPR) repeat protein